MLKKGHNFDIGDDLIRKAVFITTSICGELHPDTISTLETLSKLTTLPGFFQIYISCKQNLLYNHTRVANKTIIFFFIGIF